MMSITDQQEASLDSSGGGSSMTPVAPSLAEVPQLISYVRSVCSSFLNEEEMSAGDLTTLTSLLQQSTEMLKKLISDSQTKCFFVQKISNKDDETEDEYILSLGVQFKSTRANGIIFMKRGNFLETDKPINAQMRIMVLGEGSPYETLHSYISLGVAPYFKSYMQETGRTAESGSDKLAPSVEKKIAELEMGLLHLQQNIDIPEITLSIHPVVAQTVFICTKENRRPKMIDFGDRIEDSKFLNDLQQGVNRWVKEMQKVTKLDRDPSSGTTLQEVSFWFNLERALQKLQEKRDSQEVELTLEILRHGKRFHATVSFDTDTGLKQALAKVNDYNPLMKDFPINDLLAATDLEKVRVALLAIFVHLRKIRSTKYPITRALKLVEAISRDLSAQLLKILGTRRLMLVPFDEFDRVMSACFEIFNTWDEEYEKVQGVLREIVKKKRDEIKMSWRIVPAHKKLHDRMEQIRNFRRQHDQLRGVIERVLKPDQQTMVESNAHEEVTNAYALVQEVDVLEMSKEGQEAWDAACKRYNERVDTVEAKITAALREQLAIAKSANEMFRIFARFNALFVRPQIRGAIREYQTQLIQRVKDDIEALHEKFKTPYNHSKAARMSELRDIPPVSGSIIWAKQIDRQLTTYLRRVGAILGPEWENHVDGQRLKSDGDSFRIKLNTQPIFEEWVAKVQQKDATVAGRIFDIEQTRGRTARGKPVLKLVVNFLPEIITLSKEVRHLKNLGFRVPLAIMNKAHQANLLYPFAISLRESVRTYQRSWEKIEDKANVTLLVAGIRKEVHSLIVEGISLIWESYKLDPYVKKFSEAVFQFAEKIDEVLSVENQVSLDIKSLETCSYSVKTFGEILTKIQKAVDALSLKQYSNLSKWVQHVDTQVEIRLASRLEAGIAAWTRCLEGREEHPEDNDDDSEQKNSQRLGGDPQLGELKLELRMTQQTLWVYPSVEEVRQQLLHKLFAWEAIATSHPRIQSSRYQHQVGGDKGANATYKDLLAKLPSGSKILEKAYSAIEARVAEVRKYVDEWLLYQSLWDLQPDMLYGKLGEDINMWLRCLADVKRTRATFDTAEVRRTFGPVCIEYGKVQSKVSLKYDSWHKDVLAKLANLLSAQMTLFHAEVARSRTDLENQSIETSSTSEAVGLITYVQNLKKKTLEWESKVGVFREGQRMLERQRFQLPSNWLHIDSVEGEWSSFSEILRRKDSSIQIQVASLQAKILSEDKAVEGRTQTYLSEWEKEKPVRADLKPTEAMRQLLVFETRYTKLRDERANVQRAKEALEMAGLGSETQDRFQVAYEELQDLKVVWSELSKIWEQIDVLKEVPWLSVQPRKIRQQIDAILTQLKDLPAKLRQYPSYEHVKKLIQGYAKVNTLIIELKSEALKERHWKTLMKSLRVTWSLNELTLGQVWDVDLLKNEKILRDVIIVAQGEMALEEFLKQVRESWQTYELELVNYQNKCKLIKGWDDLFNKLKEHINSVAAMKLSPYYKVFEEDATGWEEKLNRILALFDVWIDVQRRWVYLEGIFLSSQDIKALLPMETSRYQSISTEFLGLMKRVSKSPKVLDVLNIQGVQRSLERLADLLGKIQKALGEYLERERSSFPRFYFVGDEDLLEIIGNSKNIARLQKHFKKMFAGISSVVLSEDQSTITGIASREGEVVKFINLVEVTNKKVNEWLTAIEKEMRFSLASLLAQSVNEVVKFNEKIDAQDFIKWVDSYPAQLINLAAQIWWCDGVENAIGQKGKLEDVLKRVENALNVLADSVLHEQPPLRRKKMEHLINEFVHKRTVTRHMIYKNVSHSKEFEWLRQMRFYFDPNQPDVLKRLSINMADAKFNYGFEYLGVHEKLVQTPLTDKCYLTMTQALEARLGGSPFGPAGTGKTESVKALGHQLGRFVLVFNCDETFDFQAMGRIFIGLCQVGAWGCFDEFNRLEERMLSAVSQQIQAIQEALKSQRDGGKEGNLQVELVGKNVKVSSDMAIFVTMNPGYAGRSNLPDNLKQLFRSLAMTSPDRQLIAEVMLFSQGFRTAETLAAKAVPFFRLCQQQLSAQSHYDFGLRALKSVLVSAGNVKRERIQRIKGNAVERGEEIEESCIAAELPEQEILIQSICETMVPKLVAEDIPLLFSLLSDVFPGVEYTPAQMDSLRGHIQNICKEEYLVAGESAWMEKGIKGKSWIEKVLQLYQIQALSHGVMLVGSSGAGKSTAWRVLLKALERLEGVEGVFHVIDPKALSKEALYGFLDPNTREWTDGLFTHILRKIIDNVRGERGKRQWIIFDGDVDPEWVENLNSVLDDNKLLTLPNGERLALPPNVRLLFEVEDLKHATMATVSRCGMVWFSPDVLTVDMLFHNFLARLQNIPLEDVEELDLMYRNVMPTGSSDEKNTSDSVSPALRLQREIAALLQPYFNRDGLVEKCLEYSMFQEHIMDFTKMRALSSLFCMINQAVRQVHAYNASHMDFPLEPDVVDKFISKSVIYAILWSFTGDARLKVRAELGEYIRSITTIPLPPPTANTPMIDYEITINGEWSLWSAKVPRTDVETHKVASPDAVVPTVDTVRHEALLATWLSEHKPLVLCGPPGSGKTMTLLSALRALPDMEVVGLNFSSATTPELLLKTFDHYCEYRKTPNGIVLAPVQLGKWLILFCDEINLPDMDKYGTQRVISFLRQLVEHKSFYRTSDQSLVRLERIQFVGACNPPTDPGRKPLSHRFLRHVPVVYVDYPGETSLKQIYGTFNRAMLKLVPTLVPYAEPLTNAMVEFFLKSQERFTQDMQPHYVYSPREMTRWVRGIYEAIAPLDTLSVEGLVRLWAHEALRLFQDRLVYDEEREWTNENIDNVAVKHFPTMIAEEALARPILYSNWLSKDYIPVDREELREYVKARLQIFYQEELDVPLVLFDEVLDHVLRMDRIFRQPQGHLLLIGVAGSGKTTLSRFVAWINGLKVFQIKVHNKYTGAEFDEDLRSVLRRAGCKGEKICFILDESNVLESSFLERMNTLLANGEVPGLFEGDEFTTLMTQCKEGAVRDGLMLDSVEELYKWFAAQVMRNLHVVFTMNPSEQGLKDRASTSPALFNRCVLDWFGDWTKSALFQVGKELTMKVDLDNQDWKVPLEFPIAFEDLNPAQMNHRDAVINGFVFFHLTLHKANARLAKRGSRTMAITPRHFLDFINHFVKLYNEKRSDLEEQQLHLNIGLNKIAETVEQVEEMKKSLELKSKELNQKNDLANNKLKEMIGRQQEAEQRKVQSKSLQGALEEQTKKIANKKVDVRNDLEKVEPAVRDAEQAVQGIKKQQLVEVRSMGNPPSIVKLALESICLLLGENATDWKAIRAVLMRENFISTIVNYQTEFITDDMREKMQARYLSNPDYNFEKVNRASLACGPLVKWAIAQISYSEVLKKVEPLRFELQNLEQAAEKNTTEMEEVKDDIARLEQQIVSYKEDYAQLIAEAQAIKSDLESVQSKVVRSMSLLKSLGMEQDRWEGSSEQFKSHMRTIIGDVLLSSGFLTYAGYFDQQYRHNLFATWSDHLTRACIPYRHDLALSEYLSHPDERIRWKENSLPDDDLCTENAIMLKRFNRYPLIIDPSGQATQFLMKEFSERKLTKTSFLDDSFRKNLESALRFGNPLLVQDVESYDPILNPVLNREVRRTGGRVLISLGEQDIDLSPSFVIFLSTRDPTVEFPPDVCSRVTFVNFTVTPSSLQSQCLNQVLRAERPDIDKKRGDLLKLQGEFQVRLRHLEKSLLGALNEAKGKILDDDSVITTLENLKKEAAEISQKVEETDVVINEIETVSQQYVPLAQACSSIYFTLENMHQMHFLYQYSLQFFLDMFSSVLNQNTKLANVKDHAARLEIITKDLFQVCYDRVSRGTLHVDRLPFSMMLARIFSKGMIEKGFQAFLRFKEGAIDKGNLVGPSFLSQEQIEGMLRLQMKIDVFNSLPSKIDNAQFQSWLKSSAPETDVPTVWEEKQGDSPISISIYKLLLIQAFRPDRVVAMGHIVVEEVLGSDFMPVGDVDLGAVVDEEVTSRAPVLLCAAAGFDASGRVYDLAAQKNQNLVAIAIGSAEGFTQADQAIAAAVKTGRWVLLKNVHLAPQWLLQLEKKLHSLQPHKSFRLFLTMDIHPKIPVNLLRAGRVFVFEPPPGIRANLLRTFNTVPATRMMKAPHERARLYFLVAWFHAVVQERLRYVPLGWAKHYEFNEADLRVACDTLDAWIDGTAMGRTNLPPEKIPWDALRTLLSETIYGGKVDNEFDSRLLYSFVNRLFTPKSFEADFLLVANVDGGNISMPDALRRDQFLTWANALAHRQTPAWLGLPVHAEKVLLTNRGAEMVRKLLKMQLLEDEDKFMGAKDSSVTGSIESHIGAPAWMRTIKASSEEWLKILPKKLITLRRTADNIKRPLYRFFEREIDVGTKILETVKRDLLSVQMICNGEKKQTSYDRELISELVRGIIPKSWCGRYPIPKGCTVINWINDLALRIQQFIRISDSVQNNGAESLEHQPIWLGGLISPESYFTATRQCVAQANGWSVEELVLEIVVAKKGPENFVMTGLKLQGAVWKDGLQLSGDVMSDMPDMALSWMKKDQNLNTSQGKIVLPVYLNSTRAESLFTFELKTLKGQDKSSFYERGVAILASTLS